jgi:hypothetical protein
MVWGSEIDFCFSVLQCRHHREKWELWQLLFESCGWIFPFKKICIICDREAETELLSPN